jgi:hypothetical protein
MSIDHDVAAVRAALLPAFAEDLRAAPRRRARRLRIGVATAVAVLLGSTAVAAASGVLFAPPHADSSVPAVAVWTYAAHDPFAAGGGPVLLHRRPGPLAAANRATETALAQRGVTARCGADDAHPRACYLPSGDPVDPGTLLAAMTRPDGRFVNEDGPSDYDIRPLTATEAHAWLCTHPEQRPGADGGEKAAPTAGYEDCAPAGR